MKSYKLNYNSSKAIKNDKLEEDYKLYAKTEIEKITIIFNPTNYS